MLVGNSLFQLLGDYIIIMRFTSLFTKTRMLCRDSIGIMHKLGMLWMLQFLVWVVKYKKLNVTVGRSIELDIKFRSEFQLLSLKNCRKALIIRIKSLRRLLSSNRIECTIQRGSSTWKFLAKVSSSLLVWQQCTWRLFFILTHFVWPVFIILENNPEKFRGTRFF